jgi:uncharacterized membrane protein
MKAVKIALFVVGILAILFGLLWIGQGTGYVQWPASSFMISQIRWAYYGAILVAAGLVGIYVSRKI